MSFLFGSTEKIPSAPPKALGIDEARLGTDEQGRPLPAFAGRWRLGPTFITKGYNQVVEPVKQDTPKDDIVTGYNYFADFAAVFAHGPVDAIRGIYIDEELKWSGNVARSGDSATLTVEDRGNITLFWGTETQNFGGSIVEPGVLHPGYRGLFGALFENFFIGYNQGSAPAIEFYLARWPKPAWFTAPEKVGEDANPIAALADWLQNFRYGRGMLTSRLETALLNAAAQELYDEGIGLSPFLNRSMTVRQAISMLCEYFDGFPSTTAAGTLRCKLVRALAADAPTIGVDDLLDEPDIDFGGWDAASTDVYVKFTNASKGFKSDSLPWPNRAVRRIIGEKRTKTLDRSWITNPDVAAKIIAATGRSEGLPKAVGSIRAKKSKFENLGAGDLFFLCYPPLGVNMLCRITEKTVPSPDRPRVEIEFTRDTSYVSDEYYTPPAEPYTPPVAPTILPITVSRILELPYGVRANQYVAGVGFMAARPQSIATRFAVHRKKPSGAYEAASTSETNWSRRGVVQEHYNGSTLLVDNALGVHIKLTGTDKTLPDIALEDALTNDWLLFVNDEIMSIFGATLIGTDEYRVYAIRARYDTRRATHFAGSEVFIVQRSGVPAYEVVGSLNPETFKLQPFIVGGRSLDLSECSPKEISMVYRGLRPWSPENLRAFDDGVNPTYTTGQNIPLTWSLTVPDPTGVDVPGTRLDFLNNGGLLMDSVTLDAGVTSYTWLNADLIAALGSEENFSVRAYAVRGVYTSLLYSEIKVLIT